MDSGFFAQCSISMKHVLSEIKRYVAHMEYDLFTLVPGRSCVFV